MYKNNQPKYSQGERAVFARFRATHLSLGEKRVLWKHIRYSMQNRNNPSVYESRSIFLNFFSFLTHRSFAMLSLSLVIILGSGFGIARASENALPGQRLYSVKINVNEAFIRSLKRSDDDRAEWERELTSRRITEAETLAEEGHLGIEEKDEIERHLSENRKALEEIEGRTVTDEEFLPQNIQSMTKKINVRVEHTEEETFIHIEEKFETEEDEEREQEQGFVDGEEWHTSNIESTDNDVEIPESLEQEKVLGEDDKNEDLESRKSSSKKEVKQQDTQDSSSDIQTDTKKKQETTQSKQSSSSQEDNQDDREEEKQNVEDESSVDTSDDEDLEE
ncbi:MAG: hypothetical protein PHH40_00265 [Candidatus Moranbacteria bacterium]|nr:hypothetical protein [Candidatus Moranbacteria bacterium]MDD3965300.1 hypothetical protein [Candidatus Moranbacteria bacterium]